MNNPGLPAEIGHSPVHSPKVKSEKLYGVASAWVAFQPLRGHTIYEGDVVRIAIWEQVKEHMNRRCLLAGFWLICLSCLGCDSSLPEQDAQSSDSFSFDPQASKRPTVAQEQAPLQKDFADVNEAISVLSQATNQKQKKQQIVAYTWLCGQGSSAIPSVAAAMNDASASMEARRMACRILGQLGPAAAPELIAASNSDELSLKLKAIESMPGVKPAQKTIVQRLTQLLNDPSKQVQCSAIRSLGGIGPAAKASADHLLAIRNNVDLDETTRQAAGRSLKLVRPIRTFND